MTFSLRRFLFSSLAVWLVVSIVGVYFLFHLHKFINFGIDLVGGTYITLDVQLEKAVESELAYRLLALSSQLEKSGKTAPTTSIVGETGALVFASPEAARDAETFFATQTVRAPLVRDGAQLKLMVDKEEVSLIKREALQSNINVLRSRLDPLGAGEITIAARGDRNIIVELPNVHDPLLAKAKIGKAALLEIKLVEDYAPTVDELKNRYGGTLPEGMIVVPSQERDGRQGFYLVPQFTDLTGRLIKDARMGIGGDFQTQPVVEFTFKPEGGEKFYALSSTNIGRQAAIILDGVVISAPTMQTAISTNGQITGNFTTEYAQELAMLLKSGAFSAPVTFEEERHIGPSLGAQSITNGLIACSVGMAALLLFSLFVYKVAGLLAFLVLLYNILLILFSLAWLGATLTLPGIAGMILTIGMAIDASILIFERIKEELAKGVPFKKAVDIGFSGAMAVILDANCTHLLVALVLYKLGAGAIKGFAVTMIIGILSTLVTGILLLRSIFNYLIYGAGVQQIKI